MNRTFTALFGILAIVCMAQPAEAQFQFGGQGNFSSDHDFGLGARAELNIGTLTGDTGGYVARTRGFGSFDFYFPDGYDFWEVNLGLAVPLNVGTGLSPYAGAAFNYGNGSVEGSDESGSASGLAILAGLRFRFVGLAAFGEARAVLSDADHVVATMGVLLGGGS